MNVGFAIALERNRKGWTQREFAKRVGISSNYIAQIETLARVPSLPMLQRIAQTLNVPVAILVWELDELSPNVSAADRITVQRAKEIMRNQ